MTRTQGKFGAATDQRTLQWLILPHMVRLAGVVLLFQVADGALPDAFIAPAGMAVVA